MRHRSLVLAWGLFGLTLVLAVVAVAGSLLVGLDREEAVSTYLITNTAIGLAAAPCGFLIARARPASPLGWLFLGLGLAPLATAAMVPLLAYGDDGGSSSELLRLAVTVFQFSWAWGSSAACPWPSSSSRRGDRSPAAGARSAGSPWRPPPSAA